MPSQVWASLGQPGQKSALNKIEANIKSTLKSIRQLQFESQVTEENNNTILLPRLIRNLLKTPLL